VKLVPGGQLHATVRQVEHLGHEILLVADASGAKVVARLDPSEFVPEVGDPVAFDADPGRLHRFSSITGERVS
jgi:ABC-type sugar transport system ATPase subunit